MLAVFLFWEIIFTEAEIYQFKFFSFRVDEYIVGFDVSMHDSM